VTQIVDAAIRQSRDQNEIVHVSRTEIAQAGVSLDTVHRELFDACEGEARNGRTHEYWGWDPSDPSDYWRVNVPAEVES